MENRALRRSAGDERGFAALALVMVLVPLLFLVGSYLQTMSGRNSRLQLELKEERALMVAESGLDRAIYEGQTGVLMAGHLAEYQFESTMRGGGKFQTVCTYLGDDDKDNDNDGDRDEEDEDVFRAITVGTIDQSRRRIAAYLGFISSIPRVDGAVTLTSPTTTVDLGGSGLISGFNHTPGGGLVGSGDISGLSIAPPGTLAGLMAQVTGGERNQVVGVGGTPSLGVATSINVPELVAFARNAASVVLTNDRFQSNMGSAANPVIAYRQGDLRINSNHVGYGLLVVDGNITVNGNAIWNGIVICTGSVDCGNGSFTVNGGLILGPNSPFFRLRGTIQLNYSAVGVSYASGLVGRYSAFNGWQEIGFGTTL